VGKRLPAKSSLSRKTKREVIITDGPKAYLQVPVFEITQPESLSTVVKDKHSFDSAN
jgi:hypothetical protein